LATDELRVISTVQRICPTVYSMAYFVQKTFAIKSQKIEAASLPLSSVIKSRSRKKRTNVKVFGP